MREVIGNLWDYPGADAVAVPVNGYLDYRDHVLLGGDVAHEARKRHPWLSHELGKLVKLYGNIPFFFRDKGVLTWPTKRNYRDVPSLFILECSARIALDVVTSHHLQCVVMPRLGAGPNELPWDEVRAVLGRLLDDRFVVVTHG